MTHMSIFRKWGSVDSVMNTRIKICRDGDFTYTAYDFVSQLMCSKFVRRIFH
jgi:hypothetical protein